MNIVDFNANPMFMTIEEVGKILGISKVKSYELAHIEGFPTLRVGRRILVPTRQFWLWVEAKVGIVK